MVYFIIKLPKTSLNFSIPYVVLFKKFPNYEFLKTFGCACFPLLIPYNSHKLDFRSHECLFLGYSTSHKGYKCLSPLYRLFVSKMSFLMNPSFLMMNCLNPFLLLVSLYHPILLSIFPQYLLYLMFRIIFRIPLLFILTHLMLLLHLIIYPTHPLISLLLINLPLPLINL